MMPIAACYTMDLYCDNGGEKCIHSPHSTVVMYSQYTGENWTDCVKQARKDKWKFNANNTKVICFKCRGL